MEKDEGIGMRDEEILKQKLSDIPDTPGVYFFKDNQNQIIYIGKAASLVKRVRSYFQKAQTTLKERMLIEKATDLDYITTISEAEALILESNLIKIYQPKYNVQLKDDKAYPYIKITLQEDFPRICIVRKVLNDGARYFGPYPYQNDLRKILKLIKKIFCIRTCKYKIKSKPIKPCLDFHIKRCVAPCGGNIDKQEYQRIVEDVCLFLDGRCEELIKELNLKMKRQAQLLRFEDAAKIRDQISVLERIGLVSHKGLLKEENKMSSDSTDALLYLQKLLQLSVKPVRIEAFDVSNLSGKEAVGSLVSFEDGKPDKKGYRRFKIKGEWTPNDTVMMAEIVMRRYSRLLKENKKLPDLIMIDGGKTQLNAAWKVLKSLGLEGLNLISLSKPYSTEKTDKIWTLHSSLPVYLSQDSAVLHLLQHIRDEAHRFAIQYHRKLRRIKD